MTNELIKKIKLNSKISLLFSDLNEQLIFTDLEIDSPIKRRESVSDIIL